MAALPETNTISAPPRILSIVAPLKQVGFLKRLGPGLVTACLRLRRRSNTTRFPAMAPLSRGPKNWVLMMRSPFCRRHLTTDDALTEIAKTAINQQAEAA
jgi:hypothetical protein